MDYYPPEGRGLHFSRRRALAEEAVLALETVSKKRSEVTPHRTLLRNCTVLRSNALFPYIRGERIVTELQLSPESSRKVQEMSAFLSKEGVSVGAWSFDAQGALNLLVEAPAFYHDRWQNRKVRMAIWGPTALEIGAVADCVVDCVVVDGSARFILRETV